MNSPYGGTLVNLLVDQKDLAKRLLLMHRRQRSINLPLELSVLEIHLH